MIYILLMLNIILSQTDFERVMKKGVEYHKNEEYDKAIEMYKEAIKIEPENDIAYYELAMTYFQIEDYEKAFDYGDKAIDLEGESQLKAYNLCGSALNMMGKERKAINLLKEAILQFENDYELCYNLATIYSKEKDYDEAIEILQVGIKNNSIHASSHFLLGKVCYYEGNYDEALLSLYYFLLLEANTDRTAIALQIIINLFVDKYDFLERTNDTTKIIYFPENIEGEIKRNRFNDQFSSFGLPREKTMIRSFKTTDVDLITDQTEKFFHSNRLDISKKKSNIWNDFYKPFFNDLKKTTHLETYCYYICQQTSISAVNWLNYNPDKIKEFIIWLQGG